MRFPARCACDRQGGLNALLRVGKTTRGQILLQRCHRLKQHIVFVRRHGLGLLQLGAIGVDRIFHITDSQLFGKKRRVRVRVFGIACTRHEQPSRLRKLLRDGADDLRRLGFGVFANASSKAAETWACRGTCHATWARASACASAIWG